jgi:hypothetical protein
MNRRHCSKLILFLLVVLSGSRLWAQGPPYQTDDPVPVDLHHYEFYIFGSTDGQSRRTISWICRLCTEYVIVGWQGALR